MRNVVAQRGRVGDAALEAFVAAGFTRANVLEVVTAVATKTISNYTNHITPHAARRLHGGRGPRLDGAGRTKAALA